MKRLFLTGGTGYLGSYVVHRLLKDPSVDRLLLMSRARGRAQAVEKLWKALQLHVDADAFYELLPRIELIEGDLTAPGLGLSEADRARIAEECSTILHIAASLNRKSSKACFNANLRGSLSMIQLVREVAQQRGGLDRFGVVSTTAVSGQREHETVTEDASVDWDRSDYDPYARTKKFAEHMVRELLPDVPKVILRPPTVMGDSRFGPTTQFEMVQMTCTLIDAPIVPIHPDTRLDFVPADFVGGAIAELILKPELQWDCYHLSAGEGATRASELERHLRDAGIRTPRLMPSLFPVFDGVAKGMMNAPRGQISLFGSLLKVFLPYFTNDVVFDNTRVVSELGYGPTPFVDYFPETYRWCKSVRFQYPYRPLPAEPFARAAE